MSAWYLTEYSPWGKKPLPESPIGLYGSHIWARSFPDAERKAKLRGLGERVAGRVLMQKGARPHELPSQMVLSKRLSWKRKVRIIHATCFLCFLLARSNKWPTEGTMGDEGILHQVIHSLCIGWPRRKALSEMLAAAERMVPGYVGPRKV